MNQRVNQTIGLAPMEGVTDLPTRLWFSQCSQPQFATTPFLRVTRDYPAKRIPSTFCPENSFSPSLLTYSVAPQLMGSDVEHMLPIAEHLLKTSPFVDFNCGCPAPTVVGNRAGSAILEKVDFFASYVEKLCQNLGPQNVSIKMRLGFNSESEFPALLSAIQNLNIYRLTVHGRTRTDRYLGQARWTPIDLASQSSFPVVGSGDVVNFLSAQERLQKAPNVNGVIIGRGALRNPWIFEEIRQKKELFISIKSLQISLAVYALLQEIYQKWPEKLFIAIEDGIFTQMPGTDFEKWNVLFRQLSALHFESETKFEEINCSLGTLAKIKMMWNSLRSALPECFFEPTVLRVRQFPDFLAALNGCFEKYLETLHDSTSSKPIDFYSQEPLLRLSYKSCYDWIYSGGKATHDK